MLLSEKEVYEDRFKLKRSYDEFVDKMKRESKTHT